MSQTYIITLENKGPNPDADATVRPADSAATIRPGAAGATDYDKTMRPQDSAADKTLRPQEAESDKTVKPQGPRSAPAAAPSAPYAAQRQVQPTYEVEGVVYTVLEALSVTSGEALVLLVADPSGKKYVLKLYYVGTRPNARILDKVKSINSAGILFKEYAHGDFGSRYFELIEYYEGGSLEKIDVRHNEAAISQYVAAMAAAIDLCHHLGFIHRDIKPSNFVFASPQRSKLMLGDFGIAVECDANGQCVSDMARTKIYAAPEVYLNTGDGKAAFSTKSDFYSLGITILYLWMGKDEFNRIEKGNELQLAAMKNYAGVPIPESMPPRLKSLVEALLKPNPTDRAGFNEIKAWLEGKNPFGYVPAPEANAHTAFRVIFSGEKGLVANSPKELAAIMHANAKLAQTYLYKGRLGAWLEDNGRPELAVEMERIKEDLYPQNPVAGLDAACYVLDPSMPYIDDKGNVCTTSADIAQSILNNFDSYQHDFNQNQRESRLMIYLAARGQTALVDEIQKQYAKHRRNAILYLAYRLDASQPWYMKTKSGKIIAANKCDDVLAFYANEIPSQDTDSDLLSDAFVLWVKKRNAGIAKDIAPIVRRGWGWYGVVYRLNSKADYHFDINESNPNRAYSIEELGRAINGWVMDEINGGSIGKAKLSELDDIADGKMPRLYHYLESRGSAFVKYIDWIKYCLDVNSRENSEKAGPYNKMIAYFKLVKGMQDKVGYTFKSGKVIYHPSELAGMDLLPSEIAAAKNDRHDSLRAWIAVFYQEDPNLNKSPRFAYERATVKYVEFLRDHGLGDTRIQRYFSAKQTVEDHARSLREGVDSVGSGRLMIWLLAILPMLVAAFMVATKWEPGFSGPSFSTLFGPIAVICTIICLLADGFAGRLIGEIIMGCILSAIISLLISWVAGYVIMALPYLCAFVLVCMALGFYYVSKGADVKKLAKDDILNPDFEFTDVEPLHEAYHPAADGFRSSLASRTQKCQDEIDGVKKSIRWKALPTGLVCLLGIVFFSFAAPGIDADEVQPAEIDWSQGPKGTWIGTVNGENARLVFDSTPEEQSCLLSLENGTNVRLVGNYDSHQQLFDVESAVIDDKWGNPKSTGATGRLTISEIERGSYEITGYTFVVTPWQQHTLDLENIQLNYAYEENVQ